MLAIFRLFFSLLSLVVLVIAGALLWEWYEGDLVRSADGTLERVREDWRLWVGLPLLGWSFLGRYPTLLLLARADRGEPTRPVRGDGQQLNGADGTTLYVETLGPADAAPVILTHGWSLDSTIWNQTKRELAKQFRVIVWDLPGLGRSKVARGDVISLPHLAQNLRKVLEFAGRPAVVVGHSIGGMTTQTLVRDNPDVLGRDVAGIVLVNTTHTNPLETILLSPVLKALRWPVIEPMMRVVIWLEPLVWLMAWQSYLSGFMHLNARLAFAGEVTRSELDHTALLMTRNSPGIQARGDLAMFRWDATPALPRIDVPCLVLGGGKDIVTLPEASLTIAEAVKKGTLQIVASANHMGFLEQREIYDPAISEFATGAHGGQRAARTGADALAAASPR